MIGDQPLGLEVVGEADSGDEYLAVARAAGCRSVRREASD